MATPRPRVKLPKKASKGEVITIKTLISHKMESGQRKDKDGNPIPRKIINAFQCTLNGDPVFSCDILPAISANPYLEFHARVEESGEFEFTWTEDGGATYSTKSPIEVA
jgi:sulfur-oxidizing protein SoxZ